MQAGSPVSSSHTVTRRAVLGFTTALALGLAACGKSDATASKAAPSFNAVDLSGVSYAQNWAMPDADGVRRTMKDFEGKVVHIFFGFAQCPDICPTTLLEMAEVKQALGADGDRLQVLFVTVDPERDTPEIMRAYVTAFDPSFKALVGTPEEVATMARDFKVYYKKVPGSTPDSYTIDHSAGSYLYDPNGKLRLYVKYGTPADQITQDIQALLKSS